MNMIKTKGRTTEFQGAFSGGIVNTKPPFEQKVLKGSCIGSSKQPVYSGTNPKLDGEKTPSIKVGRSKS